MNENKEKAPNIFSRYKLKKSFVGLFFGVLSILSYQILYLCIFFAILAIIYSIMGLFEKQYLSIFVIILGIGSVLGYFLLYSPKYSDPNKSKNVILGTWIYNDSGGTYVFNNDNTYYQYITENTKDNYCTGSYIYSYGFENNYGVLTLEDHDFYYYLINLQPEKCIINSKEESDNSKYKKIMIFGFNKNNYAKESIIINTTSEKIFNLTKAK